MFGYVTINKPEIRFKDYDTYRSYYCGLCRCLKKRHGFWGRMTLDYDMVFLVLLLSGLYDTDTEQQQRRRCILHPFSGHLERISEFTEYAADMNLLLFYYKCLDDWNDDRKLTRRICAALLSPGVKRVRRRYPEKAEAVRSHLASLSEAERAAGIQSGKYLTAQEKNAAGRPAEQPTVLDIDGPAGIFGGLLSEIFAWRKDVWEDTLRRLGFYLGKYIYLIDAYDDIEKDMEKKRYNPFSGIYGQPDFDLKCGEILKMMISECAGAFERLPVEDHMEILRNIIYAGVWSKYEAALQKRKDRDRENV